MVIPYEWPLVAVVLVSLCEHTSAHFVRTTMPRALDLITWRITFMVHSFGMKGILPIVWSFMIGNGPQTDLVMAITYTDVLLGGASALILFGFQTHDVPLCNVNLSITCTPDLDYIVWTYFFGVVVMIPIAEEILTRGVLYAAAEKHWRNRVVASVVSALYFSAMHREDERFWQLFFAGLTWAMLRAHTGRIGASVVSHAVYNALCTIMFTEWKRLS